METQELFAERDKFETTIGDLVVALTQVAEESGQSEEECYELASAAMTDILRRERKELGLIV